VLTHERFKCPYEFDLAMIEPVFYMMRRGIRIDERKKAELSAQYKTLWTSTQMKLNAVAGHELNVSSHPQITKWLYKEVGLPARRKKGKLKGDEDALRALLAMCESKMDTLKTPSGRMKWMRGYLGIRHIIAIRALRKRISSYIDIDIDDDGRMRCSLRIGGTETGRFSSSKTGWDTGCNMQTIPRELRLMFLADEGKELAEFDLNRGESWIYSHLSEDPSMMDIHLRGLEDPDDPAGDFHIVTACAISSAFGERIRVEDWKDFAKEKPELAYRLRYLGKRSNHAYAYQMTPFRAAEVVNKEADDTGITVTVAQTKIMRQLWLGKYIGIPAWWASIERELGANNRIMITPYGRKRTFHERWGDDLFKEATAYVPQSTSVDYLNLGMLDVYHDLVVPRRHGLELLHQNHDSILVQYDEGQRERVMPEIIERCSRTVKINGYDVVIPIEAKYGKNWGQLTEWKKAA